MQKILVTSLKSNIISIEKETEQKPFIRKLLNLSFSNMYTFEF